MKVDEFSFWIVLIMNFLLCFQAF